MALQNYFLAYRVSLLGTDDRKQQFSLLDIIKAFDKPPNLCLSIEAKDELFRTCPQVADCSPFTMNRL